MSSTIPTINPNVRYRSVAALKKLLLPDLEAALGSPVVIQDSDSEPLAVLVPWGTYLELQESASANGSKSN
jgi:hypothetical protein